MGSASRDWDGLEVGGLMGSFGCWKGGLGWMMVLKGVWGR